MLAALIAALLFDRVRGWKAYRTLLFFPYILSIPVVGIVFGYVFQLNGLLNTALETVGLGGLAQDWLGSSSCAMWSIMAVIVWKELGFGIIVFLARLMSVNEEMFESARVDGAGWWQTFRHITLPQLAPAIVFFGIVETITMLSWVFAYIYVMTVGRARELDGRERVVHLPAGLLEQRDRNRLRGRGDAARVREPPHRGAALGEQAIRRPLVCLRRRPRLRARWIATAVARAGRGRSRSTCCCWSSSLVTLIPLYFLLVNSFKSQAEYLTNPYGLPGDPTLATLKDAFRGGDLLRWLANSAVFTVASVVISTVSPPWPPTRSRSCAGARAGFSSGS